MAAGPSNADVASRLDRYAWLLERQGAPTYRSRAYRRAAQNIEELDRPVTEIAELKEIPGVGSSIATAIRKIMDDEWEALRDLEEEVGTDDAPSVTGDERGRPALMQEIRGDLHAHTYATDGRDSIRAMAEAARGRGYAYLAITDHSKETRIAGGLTEQEMQRHIERIRRVDGSIDGIRLLAGAEVDILKDGRLDFPDALLQDLDVVVCSLHFRHKLSAKEQTERILRAMSNEHADILAHPTARRKGIRPGIDLDMGRIVEAAADQGWAIEMNGAPERRDLDAAKAALAAEHGVLLALDSDAHSIGELENMRNACAEAQKADLEPEQILNTRSLPDLAKALRS